MTGKASHWPWAALAAVIAFFAIGIWVGESDDEPAAGQENTANTGSTAGDDEGEAESDTSEPDDTETIDNRRETVEITATDYAFEVPAEFDGGLVDLTLVNAGKEPHFAAFAQPREGVTPEVIRKALTSPPGEAAPAGPPPFVEYAALGTVSPGGESRMTMNLPAGPYVLFCTLPAPDGTPHMIKGMLADVEVTPGATRSLPETDTTLTTADFAIGGPLEFKAGTNTVTLDNRGKQIHELDLFELPEGKTVDDLVAWAATLQGPPPGKFLGGPGVRDGLSVTTTFEMEPGVRYAFVCIIPDSLGDFAPHITKGMRSAEFEVEP